ncbi:MAG: phosphoenolpyruvate--protein phosphotransferase [Chlamydiia bacterium]|nr:phosphoenolpyruvate--protein phosphotransferase [Chlamydiia bacterium]
MTSTTPTETQEILFRGKPICHGIALGQLVLLNEFEEEVPEWDLNKKQIDEEVGRFRRAIDHSRTDLRELKDQLEKEHLAEGAAIIDTHLEILNDPILTTAIEGVIREKGKNAEYVFDRVIKDCESKFDAIQDPFFKERGRDVKDIAKRVMGYLQETKQQTLSDLPNDSIVLVQELSASDVAEADPKKVLAFVTEKGGITSHAAIMARAKGIPYISSIHLETVAPYEGQWAIVDGMSGCLLIHPSPKSIEQANREKEHFLNQMHLLEHIGRLIPQTLDGYEIRVSANIDVDHEVEMFHQYGGCGVGLYRSEYIFLANQGFPSEEEQHAAYRCIIERMNGLPIVMRTFDIGGDKGTDHPQFSQEGNPFLGCRAIRFLLKEPTIFKTQLRAILRTAPLGSISIMFPMISALSELLEAKKLLRQVQEELDSEGVDGVFDVGVGCMIEVPSAALIADLLAKECDFLSIGTNDLVQYSLAVDRGNHAVSGFYTPTHPGVIRLIKTVITEANQVGIPVSVCGEVAADPKFTPLLVGLGVNELSVASRFIPMIKNEIRHMALTDAKLLAKEALSLSTAEAIQALLDEAYQRHSPSCR